MDPATRHVWPDSYDSAAMFALISVAIALPVLGYIFIVLDIRRYLRSLRRAISTIVFRDYSAPDWARPQIPRCIAVFGLAWPCTKDELMQAYRQQVKKLHPDHGGDEKRFLMLQNYFEEALRMVRAQEEAAGPTLQ